MTTIALGDNRTFSTETVRYWHSLLHDLRIEDALDAVAEHRRESTAWLQPAHIRAIVRDNRRKRLEAANHIHEPVADDTVLQDIARRLAVDHAAADGRLGPRPVRLALAAPATQAAVPDEFATTIEAVRARRGPLTVRCGYCQAPAGSPCTVAGKNRRPDGGHHPSRAVDARAAAKQASENGAAA